MKKFYNSPELEIVKFTVMEAIAYDSNENLDESENDWYIEETYED